MKPYLVKVEGGNVHEFDSLLDAKAHIIEDTKMNTWRVEGIYKLVSTCSTKVELKWEEYA
jgi:hypothetical protein